jgi:hypothetical protein
MEQNSDKWSRAVFRVRGLPNSVQTPEAVSNILSKSLSNHPVDSIRVFSLATTLKFWEDPPSKVATVMFTIPPAVVQEGGDDEDEWSITCGSHVDHHDHLILDTHFIGMTALNDVDSTQYVSEYVFNSWNVSSRMELIINSCVAISGLASHPFGSWQPKGANKTFMWIRDGLPKDLRGTRAIIYGYDTRLDRSQSFQLISDLALAFVNRLQTYGWNRPSSKPLVFLAHSLGGLVLKAAIVHLDNSQDGTYERLLKLIHGAVFFGVPNLGMEQAHFQTVVYNNPNEALVDDIGRGSNYLRRLNESFLRSSEIQLQCFWAYETSESPTIKVSKCS